MKNEKNILSVVMPVYNEEKTIAEIIRRVQEIPNLLELVIVDDCSTDKTGKIVKQITYQDSRIKYVRQSSNGGKTFALKCGFILTRGEIVIVQDSDLEYDPAEIADVIAPIINGNADVVYGSLLWSKKQPEFYTFITISLINF